MPVHYGHLGALLYTEDANEMMGAPKNSLSNIRKPKKRCVAEFGGKKHIPHFGVEVLWLCYTNCSPGKLFDITLCSNQIRHKLIHKRDLEIFERFQWDSC